jgi:hypothetical protein
LNDFDSKQNRKCKERTFFEDVCGKLGHIGMFVTIVVLMQEWTILKEILFNKMYILGISGLFTQPKNVLKRYHVFQTHSKHAVIYICYIYAYKRKAW